ncbi:unnamed protein product, partial [Staurois parvus]
MGPPPKGTPVREEVSLDLLYHFVRALVMPEPSRRGSRSRGTVIGRTMMTSSGAR